MLRPCRRKAIRRVARLQQRVANARKAGEPTVITRHGRKEAVLVSFEEWERVSKVPSFAELLLAFPGEPGDIPARSRKPARALRDSAV